MQTTTPTAKPCLRCGTTAGLASPVGTTPRRARGLCQQCYDHERRHGTREQWPTGWHADHPTIPTGIVTITMLRMTVAEIARRYMDAAYELTLTEAEALYRGAAWRDRHPEQFAPEAIASLYPDPAGLACSAWTQDADRRAA